MKKSCSSLFIQSAIALALAAPMLASAESQLVTGAATATGATAKLNFAVVIPKVLFLGVGAGSGLPLVPSGTVDLLTFDYGSTPDAVGNGTASAAQGVPVRVRGNNGTVSLVAAGSGTGLVSSLDSADIIPWSQITATSLDATNLDVPAVGGTSVSPARTGKVTNQNTTWNYAYSNTNVVAPGTYEGQITYTATMP